LVLAENEFSGTQCTNLGIDANLTEVEMLREYVIRYGPDLHESVKTFVILGVTLSDELAPEEDIDLGGGAWLHIRNLRWRHLASYRGYPSGTEFAEYLEWRIQHAKL